jgi:hypothetical protein
MRVRPDDRIHRQEGKVHGVQGHAFPVHMTRLTWGLFLVSLPLWTLLVRVAFQATWVNAVIWGATFGSVFTAFLRYQVNGDLTLRAVVQALTNEGRTFWAARRANVQQERDSKPSVVGASHVKITREY